MTSMLQNIQALAFEALLRTMGEGERFTFLRAYIKSQYSCVDDIRRMQLRKLQNLLRHSYRECRYYRSLFDSCHFDVERFSCLSQLSSIPVLSKSEIQNNVNNMVATKFPKRNLVEDFTGGSTGQPLRFFLDRSCQESRAAATMRHDGWAGWRLGDRIALFWGATADAPKNSYKRRIRSCFVGQQLWLNTGNLKVSEFSRFNEQLKCFNPGIILAYANSLSFFARYVNENGITTCAPKAVICSAEILTDDSRILIEKTFNCPVFNRYGCRELSVIASECELHDGLHIMAERLYLEIVDGDGRPLPEGETGDIVVTDLLNLGMPLIRYRIGDRGAFALGNCLCGRGLPRLKTVAGRVTDFVVGSDRQLVSGVFLATYVVAKRPSLGRVQILQSRPGQICFHVCPGKDFDWESDRNYLFGEMRKHVGPLTMEFKLVDEILPEPSGKILFCKSEIPVANMLLPSHGERAIN